ncbi:hypothetical protein [Streptomyces atratus]|uniref:hypothetical protein n=1 Tax=Streptomyces atratus TaxID=1893 RepID=UPI0037DA4D26
MRVTTVGLGDLGEVAELLGPPDHPVVVAAANILPLYGLSASGLETFAISDGVTGLRTGVRRSGSRGLPALHPSGVDLHHAAEHSIGGNCRQGRYSVLRAVEVAHVFELGTRYATR